MRFSVAAVIAAGALAVTSTSMAAASTAPADRESDSVSARTAYVVVDPAEAVMANDGAVFYPTGKIDSDTLVIVPDSAGTVGGMPVEELAAILDAGGAEALQQSFAGSQQLEMHGALPEAGDGGVAPAADAMTFAAPPMGYSPLYQHTTSFWGLNDSTQIHYGFGVTPGSNQAACATGRGYYRGYNGSEFGVWARMYGLGCASGGGTSGASLPWGNVISLPAFQARSTTIHMAAGSWWF